MVHCCELMTSFINDQEVYIGYLPEWRRYYIPLRQSAAIQGILYCPWCGIQLPKSLREEYYRILREEYGVEDFDDDKNLPHEFKTDQWWKKRGL